MSAYMDSLMMTIGLIDQATAPLNGIQSTITQTADAGRIGWEKMAGGTAGLVAAGFAVQGALMPAIEMDRVLGEVKSLGVTDAGLRQLQQTALEFSSEYGKSATEFVQASYDIQSAFAGINGDELADITKSSAVLAAATKSDTATITNYMGTMYGVFKNQADAMGTGVWSKQVAGMTAQSVEMFKTTGTGMSDAFTSIGANATSAGVAMNEQMAILGTLQATMSGSEAGTKYKSFLDGVGKAQDELNLSFTDSQGAMLPMYDILEKLKGKFGDTFDVAESDALKQAFGSAEAVGMIKLLMADTDGLASSINTLGNVTGMSKAESMAGAMTDQWERLDASWYAIRAGVFGLILPAINGVVGGMADGMGTLLAWTQMFPNITAYLGYAAIAIIGGAGALAAWNLAVGLSTLVTAGWASAVGVMSAVMGIASGALTWMRNAFFGLNLMMQLNPIFFIVAGIVALGAAIVGIIVYWDELTAAFTNGWASVTGFLSDFSVFDFLGGCIDWLIDKINMIPGIDIESSVNAPEVPNVEMGPMANVPVVADVEMGPIANMPVMPGIELAPVANVPVMPDVDVGSMANIPVMPGMEIAAMPNVPVMADVEMGPIANMPVMPGMEIAPMANVPVMADVEMGPIANMPTMPGIEMAAMAKIPEIPGIDVAPMVSVATMPDAGLLGTANNQTQSEQVNRPISNYLQSSQTARVPAQGYMPQMAKAMQGNGSKSTHTGDIYIKQEQPFTQAQLHEWDEMNTQ